MSIKFFLLVSRQGKVRLAKWFNTLSIKERAKIIRDVSSLVITRKPKMCNFVEYKGEKIVYRRYASLFFVCGIEQDDNELIILEVIHKFVECLDKYFGNVCELDLIFNFEKAYYVMEELLLAGELQESSKTNVLSAVLAGDAESEADAQQDSLQKLVGSVKKR
ncbi:AP-1 adaptor complex sigma subunit Aps1 [Schizosaccharomyces pombe]|uniref:AP-1 complex subunit sigma-1 n=1 Tax=Schizosaccharomyces pombe (strain 972 / ATCC 24843) TaxID=284812 RepID=AP1S1_SCHPO|nr:AP-1 adaptor complex sigma subunit Aps1 [Schizosaccharomyces pombe]Q9P7N2.1 RecName: Full=AP-1 complex subunit sigma-1; AltName: Full=Sigma1-adaptin; AltName: Full=Valproic acid-sensitive protein 2 [Schizosaccharomyces pombe 972h-]CAB76027.1 AP-1 adaptor complex sigma subunit Aps1 [Schizosaccharomyces pombe]|eukprot:NP_593410.1 AP-1 adaptor complex sigma subunit Aps1 [Schizosaccharomyces pombe]